MAPGLSSLQATSVLPRKGTERGSFRRGPACWEGPLAAPLGRLLQADAPCPETSRGEGTVCQGIITAP